MRAAVLAVLLLLGANAAAFAIQPDEMLPDPALEARAREIGKDLRCLVCQNQSIDDSDAELAHDLRMLVRKRLQAGDSDEAAKQYIVARYGDYVLLKPPFKAETWALWLGPLVLLAAGVATAVAFYRRRRGAAGTVAPLTGDERRRLDALLRDGDGSDGGRAA